MAVRNQFYKPGSSNVSKLRVGPLNPGKHVTLNTKQAAADHAFNALLGQAYTGPGTTNVASGAGQVGLAQLEFVGVYVPLSNSAPSVPANQAALVTFDSATNAVFPFRPGDLLLSGQMANIGPVGSESLVYADPLGAILLVCIGFTIQGTAGGAVRPSALVYNTTAGALSVPAGWLPNIYVLRFTT